MSDLTTISAQAKAATQSVTTLDALENLRVQYLGKSGIVTEQMKKLGSLPPEEKKSFGAEVNKLKTELQQLIDEKKAVLESAALDARLASEKIDVTLPARPEKQGKIHPISQVIDEITAIFAAQGFEMKDGPDIEDDWHNFTALNTPPHHPARAMQDTFYLPENNVLRTQTSSVQIRTMANGKPPFKIMAAGRVYRSDWDMTHSPMFHQVEGLYIDKGIHMGHLKYCLIQFLKSFFGLDEVPIRLRPSYFPFTEPSAEVDIGCKRGKDQLLIGKGDDWLEILGCGMVHPQVLKNVGLDPNEWQGFAFGLGVERLAMLKYNIPDLRAFYETDTRWLSQFGFNALDIPSLVRGVV